MLLLAPLGDALPGYEDHKEECGLIGLFIAGIDKNDEATNEAECAALCALGCTNECQTFKYDSAGKKCHYVDWAHKDIDKKYTPINLPEVPKKTKANSKSYKSKIYNKN